MLLCTLLLCCAAAAELSRVADRAGLLTSAQVSALNDRCRELSEKYDLDVIIATTNDSRGMELGMYAADLVDYNSFRKDNIILVIAMDQRKYVRHHGARHRCVQRSGAQCHLRCDGERHARGPLL